MNSLKSKQTEVLIVEIADRPFGIATSAIKEIVPALACMHMPKASPFLDGVFNMRGTVVPVVNMRAVYNLAPKPMTPSDHLVIINYKDHPVALRVDGAMDLRVLNDAEIDPPPQDGSAEYGITGIARSDNRLVFIQDTDILLSSLSLF